MNNKELLKKALEIFENHDWYGCMTSSYKKFVEWNTEIQSEYNLFKKLLEQITDKNIKKDVETMWNNKTAYVSLSTDVFATPQRKLEISKLKENYEYLYTKLKKQYETI